MKFVTVFSRDCPDVSEHFGNNLLVEMPILLPHVHFNIGRIDLEFAHAAPERAGQ